METRYEADAAQLAALDAYIKLQRASETVSGHIHGQIASYGLTTSQFAALEALYHLGPMCLKDLGQKILKSGGNMTLVVDNLEKMGLVERRRSEQDRRQVEVHLTEAGLQRVGEVFPRHVEAICRIMGVLTPEEQAQLAALTRKLGLGLNDEG